MGNKLKWTVEFEVDKSWVEDGFDLTNEFAQNMIESALPFAYSDELSAKVISSPNEEEIAKIQGYENAAEMKKENVGIYKL